MATRIDTLEPVPAPERERPAGPEAHAAGVGAREPLRQRTRHDPDGRRSALLLAWVVYRIGRFVFVDARWEVVERNITNLMVGRLPARRDLAPLGRALRPRRRARVRRRRHRRAAAPRGRGGPRESAARRAACGGSARSSSSSSSSSGSRAVARGARCSSLAISAVGALFNVVGRRTPQPLWRYVPLIVLAGVFVAFLVVDGLRRRRLEPLGRVSPDGLPGRGGDPPLLPVRRPARARATLEPPRRALRCASPTSSSSAAFR